VILVDTSIWIDHLRVGDKRLIGLLDSESVLVHPFVVVEIALGNLLHRERVLRTLQDLPHASVATDQEVLRLIDRHALAGSGIGFVDAHLLAATRLTAGASLWTRDKRLFAAAERLGLAADPWKTRHAS
jgi:predicted nucleic acid-binding protein